MISLGQKPCHIIFPSTSSGAQTNATGHATGHTQQVTTQKTGSHLFDKAGCMVDEQMCMHLEIDKHSINITTCPTCNTDRLATFDVIALTSSGAGKITELTRCYKCDPHAE